MLTFILGLTTGFILSSILSFFYFCLTGVVPGCACELCEDKRYWRKRRR
jgi:hypothetical protein